MFRVFCTRDRRTVIRFGLAGHQHDMKLERRLLTMLSLASFVACGGPSTVDRSVEDRAQRIGDRQPTSVIGADHSIDLPGIRTGPSAATPSGNAPDLGLGPLYSNAGAFTFPNGTNPGSASFTGALVMDPFNNVPPTNLGTGAWSSIHANGNVYASTGADAVAAVFPDPNGVDYLVLSAFEEQTQPNGVVLGTVIHVIVLPSDFSVGGTVQLDGIDRLVVFAHGDINQPSPQVAAAAISGTVTFTSGGTNIGDRISATIAGDFGDIQWSSPPPPPPPPPGNGIAAGLYTMTVDTTPHVRCDGTLAGQETAFAGVTAASLGFNGGAVTIATASPGSYAISGTPIQSGFGSASLVLDPMPDAPPDVVAGMVNGSGSGPAQTSFMGTYLLLDGTAATATSLPGFAGGGYLTAAQDGFCTVDFLVDLAP